MNFFYGLLTAVVFFILFGSCFYVGYKIGRRKKPLEPTEDEYERMRMEQLRKDFVEVMNYDLETALQRKKVK